MSAFNDSSFTLPANDFVPNTDSTRSFNDDGYSQQQSDSFAHSHLTETEHYSAGDSLILNDDDSFTAGDDILESHFVKYNLHSISVHEMDDGLSPRQEMNGIDGGFGEADAPVLSPPPEILREENFALREWRREDAIRIEEKGKKEKELLSQIIEEANKYKVGFYSRREITCQNNKETNREKEKVFLANQVKFHAEADKNYWNAIADLIPNEVSSLEKKKGKKEQEGKPSITIVQGPKPGKPTDLTRMRHLLLKLKHSAPLHLTPSPQSAFTHEYIGANTSRVGSSTTSVNSETPHGAVALV